jgi:cobalt-zinc-cadmium efflux system outer membrane protein
MRYLLSSLLLLSAGAQAQSLHDAVEAAWVRKPLAQAHAWRRDELAARHQATQAWTPAPPSLTLRHRTDQLNGNAGVREIEAELALPLWLPGQRGRESAVLQAEQALQDDVLAGARWKLAGEVRESVWQIAITEGELRVARQRLADAAALSADVERRFKAGDLARTDFNQAKAAEHAARSAVGEAEVRQAQAQQSWRTLTSLDAVPAGDEVALAVPPALTEHPALKLLERSAAAAEARQRQAAGDRRDNPELTLGYRRERAATADPYASSVTLGIRIPFASDARNQPKLAATNADFIEARTAYLREQDRLDGEIRSAQREWLQAQAAVQRAEQRQRLAAETDQLLGKAFSLGEIDLATRLRVAADRSAADADLARARLEAARAVSRLNQAFGVLP